MHDKVDVLYSYWKQDKNNSVLGFDAFDQALFTARWDVAKEVLDFYLTSDVLDLAWSLKEVDFLLAQKKYPEAQSKLRNLENIQDVPEDFKAVVQHNLAYIDLRTGAFSDSAKRLSPIIQSAQASTETQKLWLQALHRVGDLQPAFDWILDMEAHANLAPEVAGVASLIALDLGDIDATQRWLEIAQHQEGQGVYSLETLVAQASVALAAKNPDAAVHLSKQALRLNEKDGRTWSAMAFSHLLKNDFVKANRDFKYAVEYMPDHIGTWHGKGWTHLFLNDIQAAYDSFSHALTMDRNFAESHGAMAVVLALSGRTKEAQEHIEKALRLDRHNLSGRYAQAILNGEIKDAKTTYRLANRLLSNKAGPLGGKMSDWLPEIDKDYE